MRTKASKKAVKKAAKKAAQKASKKAFEKDAKSAPKGTENPSEDLPEETQENLVEENSENDTEKTSEDGIEGSVENASENTVESVSEDAEEMATENTDEKATETTEEKASETAGEKTADKTGETTPEDDNTGEKVPEGDIPGTPTDNSPNTPKDNTKVKKKRKNKAARKTAKKATEKAAEITKKSPEPPLYLIQDIPGKGKGLVAARDIPIGTRIIMEKPLLTTGMLNAAFLELDLVRKVNDLSPVKRAQFLALHDNYPDGIGYSGIFRTNAIPRGQGSFIGGIYPTISRINHSCVPNTYHRWNTVTEQETIHAIRPISAGDELTISYTEANASFSTRQKHLKLNFGFDCKCPLCDLPEEDIKASDERRVKMEILDKLTDRMAMVDPDRAIRVCHDLYIELHKEFQGYPGILVSEVYYDAFQLAVADGDEVRAKIFAERTHAMRLICQGPESEMVVEMLLFKEFPKEMDGFGIKANPATKERWHTEAPGVEGSAEFELWLWRLDKK